MLPSPEELKNKKISEDKFNKMKETSNSKYFVSVLRDQISSYLPTGRYFLLGDNRIPALRKLYNMCTDPDMLDFYKELLGKVMAESGWELLFFDIIRDNDVNRGLTDDSGILIKWRPMPNYKSFLSPWYHFTKWFHSW